MSDENFVHDNTVLFSGVVKKDDDNCKSAEEIINAYAENFEDGIGTLPGKVHLKIDVQPIESNSHRVHLVQKDDLRKEHDRLIELGVTVQVDEPSDWVSNLVIAPKKLEGIRICLDPKHLDEVLKHEHY